MADLAIRSSLCVLPLFLLNHCLFSRVASARGTHTQMLAKCVRVRKKIENFKNQRSSLQSHLNRWHSVFLVKY